MNSIASQSFYMQSTVHPKHFFNSSRGPKLYIPKALAENILSSSARLGLGFHSRVKPVWANRSRMMGNPRYEAGEPCVDAAGPIADSKKPRLFREGGILDCMGHASPSATILPCCVIWRLIPSRHPPTELPSSALNCFFLLRRQHFSGWRF